MKAIISDIHSNLEALRAVLADIDAQGGTGILCLGDIIGYGPNPRECLDLVMERCELSVLGNHDEAAMYDPKNFNPFAERAILWTRAQLELPGDPRVVREARWEYLAELRRTYKEGGHLYVHGSPRNPTSEYIFPEDVYNRLKMERLFAQVERCCFHGHTHVPGIFTQEMQYYHPEEINGSYKLDGKRALCNVGSVGQPRDNDRRACYVLFDGETIRFRRVAYDYEVVRQKIRSIPELAGGRDWFAGGSEGKDVPNPPPPPPGE